MSIFREIPPTAGFPIYTPDLLAFLITLRYPAGYPASLEDCFKQYLGVKYAQVVYSGTTAFYLILEALKDLSSKKTVIIPSFICPLVPLAIIRAGLKVEVCDIAQESFDFDLGQLETICVTNKDILAIVAAHLGGIPLDFVSIANCAKRHGIFIIEDCAQSLGAAYNGAPVGTLGDFSFFSLCRGKGLTIYEGGVVVTRKEEYGQLLDKKIKLLIKKDFFSEGVKICELFGYWIFYRPLLFWFVFGLPRVFWELRGETWRAAAEYFSVNFATHAVSGFRKWIGASGFYRLDEEIEKQRQKAIFYFSLFEASKGAKVLIEKEEAKATYPFVTLVFEDSQRKNKALRELCRYSLGVSLIYAAAITDYDYLKGFVPGHNSSVGRSFFQRHIALSTSTFLKKEEIMLVADIIKKC